MHFKKTLLSLLLVFVLLPWQGAFAEAEAFPDLVVDGSMEVNNMNAWRLYGTPGTFVAKKYLVDPACLVEGVECERMAMHLDTRGTSGGVQQLNIPVQKGRTYQFSFWYRLLGGSLTSRVGIRSSNIDFAGMSETLSQVTPGENQWGYVRYVTIPDNYAGDFRLVFSLQNGEAYIDNVHIIDMEGTASWGTTWFGDYDGLIRDPFMGLSGTALWKPYGTPRILEKRIDRQDAPNQYLYLNTIGGSAGVQQLNIPVKAGRKYKLNFSYKVSRGILNPMVGIGTSNSDFEGVYANLRPDNVWKDYSRVINIPQNFVKNARLVFYLKNGEAAIDNVMMEDVTGLQMVDYGSLQVLEPDGNVENTFLLGTQDAEVGSFRFIAGSAENISVRDITFRINGGWTGPVSLDNYELFLGDQKISDGMATVEAASYTTTILFSGMNMVIPRGQTVSVKLKADVLDANNGGIAQLGEFYTTLFPLGPSNLGPTIVAYGMSSGVQIKNDHLTLGPRLHEDVYLQSNGFFINNVIAIPVGALAVSQSPDPIADVISVGDIGVSLLEINFAASNAEDFELRGLKVKLIGANVQSNFSVVKFMSSSIGGNPVYVSDFVSADGTVGGNLNPPMLIKRGTTETITVAVSVRAASLGDTVMASIEDVTKVAAVGVASGEGVVAGSFPINGKIISIGGVVAVAGTLTSAQEGSPDSSIGIAGSAGVVMARYKFTAENEAFTITKLNVVGTTTNATAFNGTPSAFTGGNNIQRVGVTYLKKDGTPETVYAWMSQGKASFRNLNFYVPKDGDAAITILANLNTIDWGATSGASVRLGLNENADVAANNFEAMGEVSNEIKNATNVNAMANSNAVNPVVIRKTVPTVAKLAGAPTRLINGPNDIASITISADARENVSLKRLKFEFNSTGVDVNSLGLYRKIGAGPEEFLTNQVSIKNRVGANLKAGGANLSSGTSTVDSIFVMWDNLPADQETISKGVANTYTLRANVANADVGDFLATYIADDTTFIAGDTANGVVGGNYNFVWSDNSAPAHSTATRDWTNGTDVISLPTQTQPLFF